jgi:hypothetical protein
MYICITLLLIGPNKKGLHIIGQIIYYVTDLKNVTLLDYGGVVTWRHLVLVFQKNGSRVVGRIFLNVLSFICFW